MGESVGVSVSFGKYENDGGLCWEKWSTFSPNKYLEEVGKCSTPGSVAQKKAFFEAHYKKIAAMKAQAEEDQEEDDHSTADNNEQQKNVVDGSEMDKPVTVQDNSPSSSPITTLNSTNVEEVPVEPVEDNSPSPITTLNSNLEAPNVETMKQQQQKQQHFHVTPPPPPKQTTPNKINPNKVEKNSIGMKKKAPNSPLPKPKPTSAPKPSSYSFNKASSSLYKSSTPSSSSLKKTNTPSSSLNNASSSLNKASSSLNKSRTPSSSSLKKTSTPSSSLNNASSSLNKASAPTSSLKKRSTPSSSSLSSSKNKNYSASERRGVASASLHLSMSMNSVNSDTSSSVTSSRRRSLFMEQMGDKDIVKRAFKTFQNRFNQLPSYDTGPKQRSQQKTWTSMVYQKENERSRKAAEEKINPARGQIWKPAEKKINPARGQTGSLKGVGVDERTSIALKNNERRKEFFRKLEEKSNARKAEESQLSLKLKEVKDAEMKRVRQKAKAQGVLKST